MSSASGSLLEQFGRERQGFFAHFEGAACIAVAVITVAREAWAPMPNSMRSVWPWTTRTCL